MPEDGPLTTPIPGATDRLLADPVLRRLALVVVLGSIMSVLDTTIVNVAIETLGRDFHTTVTTIQWVTTGYLLALAVVIPISGWMVERFGAKRMWIISVVLFTLGSAACGLSWSTGSLIAFRIVQGLGGGMILPIGQTVIARAAGPARMGRMMAVLGVPTLLGPVLGPMIGGLIVDSVSWRWIFFVNVPIGVVAVALSLAFLSDDERQDAGRLDVVGALLLSPGLAALIYGLSEAGSGRALASPAVVVSVVVGAALVLGFVVHSRRTERPLMDMGLFKDRTFAVANFVTFIFGGALFAAMILIPLYYQVVRGDSALKAGLLMAPQGLGAMITMPMGGKLLDRLGPRAVVPLGMAIFVGGSVLYTQIGASTSYVLLIVSLFVRGMGVGWTIMPITAAAYLTLARSAVARATTALTIVMRVGGAFGTALVAVVLQRQIDARLPHLSGILSEGPPPGAQRVPLDVARPLASAFGVSFWVVLAISAVGLVGSFLLPRRGAAAPLREVAAESALSASTGAVALGD